jgi:hypothetical protein
MYESADQPSTPKTADRSGMKYGAERDVDSGKVKNVVETQESVLSVDSILGPSNLRATVGARSQCRA